MSKKFIHSSNESSCLLTKNLDVGGRTEISSPAKAGGRHDLHKATVIADHPALCIFVEEFIVHLKLKFHGAQQSALFFTSDWTSRARGLTRIHDKAKVCPSFYDLIFTAGLQ